MSPQVRCKKPAPFYANVFKCGFNAFEFVIDFGHQYTETEKAELCRRIVISPGYVKELCELLRRSIEQYEGQFGVIKTGEE